MFSPIKGWTCQCNTFCDVACVLREPALFLEAVSEFGHLGCMEVGALFSLTKEKAILIFLLSETAYDSF